MTFSGFTESILFAVQCTSTSTLWKRCTQRFDIVFLIVNAYNIPLFQHTLIACPLVPNAEQTASSVLQQLQQFDALALQPIVLFTRPDNYEQVHV